VFLLVNEISPLAQYDSLDFMTDLKGKNYLVVSQDTLDEISPYVDAAQITVELIAPHQSLLKEFLLNNNNFFVLPEFALLQLASTGTTAVLLNNFPIEVGGYLVFRPNPSIQIQEFIHYMIRAQAEETEPTNSSMKCCQSGISYDNNIPRAPLV
jgi:hypothetical protein